jgi:hypothetical protein
MTFSDPRKVLNELFELICEERYAEALARAEWFYDQATAIDPSLVGVRRSFFLSDFVDLAEVFPPAREALAKRQEEARRLALEALSADAFLDFHAICTKRGEVGAALEVFAQLRQQAPDVAAAVVRAVAGDLARSGQWEVLNEYLPDPLGALHEILGEVIRSLAEPASSEMREADLAIAYEEVDRLVATLEANGRIAEADAVRQRWAAFVAAHPQARPIRAGGSEPDE